MDNVDFFANEYDEENWRRFSECFKKCLMLDYMVPEDIRDVLVGLLGVEESIKWLNREIKQLDSKKPIELIKSVKGSMALKALIMRFPN